MDGRSDGRGHTRPAGGSAYAGRRNAHASQPQPARPDGRRTMQVTPIDRSSSLAPASGAERVRAHRPRHFSRARCHDDAPASDLSPSSRRLHTGSPPTSQLSSRPAGRGERGCTSQLRPAPPPRARPRRCAEPRRAPSFLGSRPHRRLRARARAPLQRTAGRPPRPRGRARRGRAPAFTSASRYVSSPSVARTAPPPPASARVRRNVPTNARRARSRTGNTSVSGAPHTRRGGAQPQHAATTHSLCCDSPHDQSVGAMDGGCTRPTHSTQHALVVARRSTAGGLPPLPFLRAAGIWRSLREDIRDPRRG